MVKNVRTVPVVKAEGKPSSEDSQGVIARLEARNSALSSEIADLRRKLFALSDYVYSVRGLPLVEASVFQELFWLLQAVTTLGPKKGLKRFLAYRTIKQANVFDADLYRTHLALNLTPAQALWHYVCEGFLKGGDPCAGFDVKRYLENYHDIREAGIEPLSHFIKYGEREHRTAWPSDYAVGRIGSYAGANRGTDAPATHPWPMAEQPDRDPGSLGLFDVRPDDPVPVAGARAQGFLDTFRLMSETPDFKGAVAALARHGHVAPEAPDVSIVVPVYGELAWTLNSLNVLLTHQSHYSFEILVGDDASPDATGTWLPEVEGIRYIRHARNGGFIANCNATVAQARGRYVVLLNNDTCVVEEWLDTLIDSFDRFPKAGLVGSKLFYPDGRLQEAGGIVWQDGSAWNYGRNDDPNRPEYGYARRIDYVSGCSIALPRKVWDEMGGFDDHFAPAYYEDVDLCFRLRDAGYETWFQPMSRVIHYEGRTSGTDTAQGVKAYQATNREKLLTRWKDVLAAHRPNGQDPWLERDRQVDKRVLVIDAANPTPWMDAGSVAIINLFRYYQANGYQVSFVADNLLYQRRAVSEMSASGVQTFYVPYQTSIKNVLQTHGEHYASVHVIRAEIAGKHYDTIRTYAPQAKAIYQNCDLHYLRMERQGEVEKNPKLLADAKTMKVKELRLSREYDLTITHSEVEKTILDAELPDRDILVMPLIEKVVPAPKDFDARTDLMFLGGYGHPPNVDAALWLINDVWPALAKALPHARLLIVGAHPTAEIRAHASDRIIVTGLVDELAPWFAQTRLFLAALRYGAGAKGKVLAALAHGVPVVATDVAAEGMPIEDYQCVFLAQTAQEIVATTKDLYGATHAQWDVYSRSGQAYIQRHHSFETGVHLLQSALRPAGQDAA